MKTQVFLLSLLAVIVVGCDNKSSEPASSTSSGSLATAPVDYLAAAAKAQKSAVKTIDTVSLNNAIQMFGGEQGRYPTNLNELISKKYLKEMPPLPHGTEIEYDAKTGSVKIVTK